MTMSVFLCYYYASFWKLHFEQLKMIDPVSEISGHASRRMGAHTFLMRKHLQNMIRLWSSDESFKLLNDRQPLHAGDESNMLFSILPKSFLKDADSVFSKHFARQQASNKLLPLTLASAPEVPRSFTRQLLNKPAENNAIKCNSHEDGLRLPLLMSHASSKADLDEIKKQPFFSACSFAISKLSDGASSFDSDNSDAISFKLRAQENWMPLPSATHLVGSKVKDAAFCKSTGKSKQSASNLAMTHSLAILMASSAKKESDDFKNRVRRNNDAKGHLYGMQHDEQLGIPMTSSAMKESDDSCLGVF